MKRMSRMEGEKPTLMVIPMIDIIFFLLVFFIYNSTTILIYYAAKNENAAVR